MGINFATDINYDEDNIPYDNYDSGSDSDLEAKEKLLFYYKKSYRYSKQEEIAKAEVEYILEDKGITENELLLEREKPGCSSYILENLKKELEKGGNSQEKLKFLYDDENKFILRELKKLEGNSEYILEYFENKNWKRLLTAFKKGYSHKSKFELIGVPSAFYFDDIIENEIKKGTEINDILLFVESILHKGLTSMDGAEEISDYYFENGIENTIQQFDL